MSRIAPIFERLKQDNRKALIPFITAGDPDPSMTVLLMHELVKVGADIIELGVPFSDPMADGPIIQRSYERALKHHVSLKNVLEMVAEFRRTNIITPVILMGYANPLEAMGYQNFSVRAKECGVD
ncbi:MAG: tryptophan synthase subunit alpha, partial [Nitrosomonadales bacterium]